MDTSLSYIGAAFYTASVIMLIPVLFLLSPVGFMFQLLSIIAHIVAMVFFLQNTQSKDLILLFASMCLLINVAMVFGHIASLAVLLLCVVSTAFYLYSIQLNLRKITY